MTMIGVQTGGLTQLYGVDGAYKAIKEAGFQAADANLDEMLISQDVRKKQRSPVFEAEGEELLRYFPWEYDQMCQPTEFASVKDGSRDKAKQLGVELIEPSCHYFLRSFNPTDKRVDVVSFKSIKPVEYINREYVRPAVRIDKNRLSAILAKLNSEKGKSIEVPSDEVTYDFLIGYWSSRNGMHTFEMKKDYGYITTIPVVPRSGDTYDLIDGVLYKYFASNPGNKTANLKFTKISDTEIEVYSYQTKTTYTLIKRR